MIPTIELRTRLRKLLNEVIPPGGTENDTNFLDTELDEILIESSSIYGAASTGWAMKAGLLQSQIESYSVGQERYDLTSLKDQLSHALAMASHYASTEQGSRATLLFGIEPPEVL